MTIPKHPPEAHTLTDPHTGRPETWCALRATGELPQFTDCTGFAQVDEVEVRERKG